jgi:hypothetical protein
MPVRNLNQEADAYIQSLHQQAKLASDYNDAVQQYQGNVKLNITPVAEPYESAEQKASDFIQQYQILKQNVKELIKDPNQVEVFMDTIKDVNTAFQINSHWPEIADKLKFRKYVDAQFLGSFILRLLTEGAAVTQTGLGLFVEAIVKTIPYYFDKVDAAELSQARRLLSEAVRDKVPINRQKLKEILLVTQNEVVYPKGADASLDTPEEFDQKFNDRVDEVLAAAKDNITAALPPRTAATVPPTTPPLPPSGEPTSLPFVSQPQPYTEKQAPQSLLTPKELVETQSPIPVGWLTRRKQQIKDFQKSMAGILSDPTTYPDEPPLITDSPPYGLTDPNNVAILDILNKHYNVNFSTGNVIVDPKYYATNVGAAMVTIYGPKWKEFWKLAVGGGPYADKSAEIVATTANDFFKTLELPSGVKAPPTSGSTPPFTPVDTKGTQLEKAPYGLPEATDDDKARIKVLVNLRNTLRSGKRAPSQKKTLTTGAESAFPGFSSYYRTKFSGTDRTAFTPYEVFHVITEYVRTQLAGLPPGSYKPPGSSPPPPTIPFAQGSSENPSDDGDFFQLYFELAVPPQYVYTSPDFDTEMDKEVKADWAKLTDAAQKKAYVDNVKAAFKRLKNANVAHHGVLSDVQRTNYKNSFHFFEKVLQASQDLLTSGAGLSQRHRGRYVVGRGILPTVTKKYEQFGKYLIHIPSLEKSVLNVKFPSYANVPGFPQRIISKDLKDFFVDLFHNSCINKTLFEKLSSGDQLLFKKLCKQSSVDKTLGVNCDDSDDSEDLKRFELVRGEIMSGNNNPSILKEMKLLTMKLVSSGRIPKSAGYDLLYEISALV